MAKLIIGDMAPAFVLKDQRGEPVALEGVRGSKVLVYFFPKADTPGCTTQACSVSENLSGLVAKGVKAVGISPDTPAAQKKFDDKYALGFPLLADEDLEVAAAYGVWDDKSQKGIVRSAFLIDEVGKVAGAWYKVSPTDTVSNVLAALG